MCQWKPLVFRYNAKTSARSFRRAPAIADTPSGSSAPPISVILSGLGFMISVFMHFRYRSQAAHFRRILAAFARKRPMSTPRVAPPSVRTLGLIPIDRRRGRSEGSADYRQMTPLAIAKITSNPVMPRLRIEGPRPSRRLSGAHSPEIALQPPGGLRRRPSPNRRPKRAPSRANTPSRVDRRLHFRLR